MDPLGPLKSMNLGPLKFKKTKIFGGSTKVHESPNLQQPLAANSLCLAPVFGTQFYRTSSATVLSADRRLFATRGCRGVFGSLLQGSFRLLLQSHKIKADLEIAIFKLTPLMYIIKLK